MQQLLAQHLRFTAVVAFNDMSAIGAIRALQDFGLRVPADVSVIGLDDIHVAAFNNPRLTTIRQPLTQMGGRRHNARSTGCSAQNRFGNRLRLSLNS